MAAAIVLSIKPRWVREILSGNKTMELRTKPPKVIEPTLGLIYETSPAMRLVATCELGPVLSAEPLELWQQLVGRSCVSKEEFQEYFFQRKNASALPLSKVEPLARWIPLAELRGRTGFVAPQSWCYAKPQLLAFLGV
jgi:predicted transcriptional regulator